MIKDSKKTHSWTSMPHARGAIHADRITPKFEMERDLHHARQLRDEGTTEAERRRAFKAERRTDVGSKMVRQHVPTPTLKPSPRIASGPDRTSYNDRLSAEREQARRASWIKEARATRDSLQGFRQFLGQSHETIKQADLQYASGDQKGAWREMLKLERSIKDRARETFGRAKAVTRDTPDR